MRQKAELLKVGAILVAPTFILSVRIHVPNHLKSNKIPEVYRPVVFGKETTCPVVPANRTRPVTCRVLWSQRAFPQRDDLSCHRTGHRTGQVARPGQRTIHL